MGDPNGAHARPWRFLMAFLAPGIDQVCPVGDSYQISLNSDDFWKMTLVTTKFWCRIINFWPISLNIDPLCFLNISAYPGLKEDHFGAKKSLKSQLIKILEHFFWKPFLFFLGQSFEKFWISRPAADPELSSAIVEKKSASYSQKWAHSSHFSVFWKYRQGVKKFVK